MNYNKCYNITTRVSLIMNITFHAIKTGEEIPYTTTNLETTIGELKSSILKNNNIIGYDLTIFYKRDGFSVFPTDGTFLHFITPSNTLKLFVELTKYKTEPLAEVRAVPKELRKRQQEQPTPMIVD